MPGVTPATASPPHVEVKAALYDHASPADMIMSGCTGLRQCIVAAFQTGRFMHIGVARPMSGVHECRWRAVDWVRAGDWMQAEDRAQAGNWVLMVD
jgi:hypothetical protein